MSLPAYFHLIIKNKDKVGWIIVHAVPGSQEELTTIPLGVVDEGSCAYSGSVLSQQHGHRINLTFLNKEL